MNKKLALCIMSLILACGTVLGLAGCGQNNEEVIRESIASQLDAFKNADDSAMSEIAEMVENEGLDRLGIDGMEFAAAVLDGFDYNIDSVEVDGNKAVATVTIASKSYSQFEQKVNEIRNSIAEDTDLAAMSEEDATKAIGQKIMSAFAETETTNDVAVINYELSGNVWKPTNAAEALAQLDSIVFSR